MNKYQQVLNKLDGGEKDILSKLDGIFSSLNENEGTKQKGIEYIKKNFRNFSQAMLMALLLNPNISAAINNSSPELLNQIKTELSTYPQKSSTVNKTKSTGIIVVDFGENFSSGKFDLQNNDNLKQKLISLKKYNSDKYNIKITASESQVTNPSGFGKGGLAKKRAEVLKLLLEKSGITVNIEVETVVGSTPYTKGKDNPEDDKFTQEQFVRVEVTTPYQSLCGLGKFRLPNGEQGKKENNYITANPIVAGDGKISFNTGQIPDRLVTTTKDGSVIKDLGYVATKVHDAKEWTYMPTYVAQLTKLYKEGNESVNSSKLIKKSFSSFEELVNFMLRDKGFKYQEDRRQEVKPGLQVLKQLFESGQKEFVFYTIQQTPTSLNFVDTQDYSIKVYSPLGQTGYDFIGSECQ